MLRQKMKYAIILFLFTLAAVYLYFLYFVNEDPYITGIGTIVFLVILVLWLLVEKTKRKPVTRTNVMIQRIVLISPDGQQDKQWQCGGATSFLIGKGTPDSSVNIDLSDHYYADFIAREHAVLNFAGGYWYIEDLGSANGVGIKKRGEEYALRLKPFTSYKVDEGDILYIAKIRLLVL